MGVALRLKAPQAARDGVFGGCEGRTRLRPLKARPRRNSVR